MNLRYKNYILFVIIFLSFIFILIISKSEKIYAISIDKPSKNNFVLDSIFPVENIIRITVSNNYGKYVLNDSELKNLKAKLKIAKFAGGLLVKPGHIYLELKLKDNSVIESGYVYASTGSIHFDNGINKFGESFSGTFILPVKLNFDNYKQLK